MFKFSSRNGEKDLTKGPIGKTLFYLSVPVILGMVLQTGYNIADTYFIGLLGSEELAAISVTFPVVFIFIAIAAGLSVGSTALVSQALGARKKKEANNMAEHSLLLSLIVGIIIAVCGILFSAPLFEFMGVSGHVLDMTIQYSNLIFIGFIFLFIGFISQGIIQAGGDTVTPAIYLFISVILNIILDPIMIFGFGQIPAMGLAGGAVATVLSRGVGASLNIIHLLTGKSAVDIDPKCFCLDFSIMKRIITVGIPSSVSNSINSIGMIALMSIVGGFGTAAIAAFGVGVRLESLAIMPVIGLSTAVTPFIGQNLGAGKLKRAKKSIMLASVAVIGFMGIFSLVWYFGPSILYSPFTQDPDVMSIGINYLQIIAAGYIFMGLSFIINAAFQGSGHTRLQLFVNSTRWIFVVAIAFMFVSAHRLNGVWIGFPIGNFAGFVVAFTLYKSGLWLKGFGKEKI
ncbi:MAG: MATE family efflux transporter [Candidatus Aenigmarchaeota archaeon]|nr:MATE family efflux transporter [Candidatus Aenigmarchaeota archaeon]